jgi:hypothetical protein
MVRLAGLLLVTPTIWLGPLPRPQADDANAARKNKMSRYLDDEEKVFMGGEYGTVS